MSKIWKNPIQLPQGVQVTLDNNIVTVKGPKGILSFPLAHGITASLEDTVLHIECNNQENRKYRGTSRAIIAHMVHGVNEGYTKSLQVIGVWYDAMVQWNSIQFKLWFSHPVTFPIPDGVSVKVDKDPKWNAIISLASHDKQLIGQTASKIRDLKKPEPYKGKWIRYLNEVIKLKAGKTAKK